MNSSLSNNSQLTYGSTFNLKELGKIPPFLSYKLFMWQGGLGPTKPGFNST